MAVRCPYCRYPIKSGSRVHRCDACGASHHAECWQANGGCAVYGCRRSPTPTEPARAPAGEPCAPRDYPAVSVARPTPSTSQAPPQDTAQGWEGGCVRCIAVVVIFLLLVWGCDALWCGAGREDHTESTSSSHHYSEDETQLMLRGVCPTCRGAGLVVCDACRGTGVCAHCGGTGQERCCHCSGTGRVTCTWCEGYGMAEDGSQCSRCWGTGWVTCTWCNGTGWELCMRCHGTGKYDRMAPPGAAPSATSGTCSDCNGRGIEPCWSCGGTGRCPACAGDGWKRCPDCKGTGRTR